MLKIQRRWLSTSLLRAKFDNFEKPRGRFNDQYQENNFGGRNQGWNQRGNQRSNQGWNQRDNQGWNQRDNQGWNQRGNQNWNQRGRQGRKDNFQGNFQGNFRGNRNGFRGRRPNGNDQESEELINRTARNSKNFGDGLMGQPDYKVATPEEIADLQWTDLIGTEQPETAGVSAVPTKSLAERRLLSLPLVNSLIHNRKYEWLTPVQAQTLVPILKGDSVVVRAKTGTGKTAAFSIPILQKVLEQKENNVKSDKVHALIVSPTRELAQQIADEIYKITQFGGLNSIKVQSLVGGVPKDRQISAAGFDGRRKVADIVVCTPGRLLDVLGEPEIAEKYFDELAVRVFDEADQILDIGFEREMERARQIIDRVNNDRKIPLLLFSATADSKMRQFAQNQLGERVKVVDTVPKDEPTANELVEQHAVACRNWADLFEAASKEITTSYEAAQEKGEHFKAIVFLPTTALVDHYERVLKRIFGRNSPISTNVLGIHGQRKQQSRQSRADRFRKEKDAVLITTDVVARGMDFPKVTHVFQLGPPTDVASYVHRIGRTARIGNSGKSYIYYTGHMRSYLDALARANIKPSQSVYTTDPDSREALHAAFESAISGDEEARELLMSLMSYMTVIKSKFNIDARTFINDMEPFLNLLGMEEMRLGAQMRQTWSTRSRFQNKKGFGSSRKTRMRW